MFIIVKHTRLLHSLLYLLCLLLVSYTIFILTIDSFFSTVCLLLQGSGFGCAVLVFFLQFLFAWLYHKSKFANLKATENSTRFKILRLIGYDVVIMIALIGNVASFRGFWNILDVYFLPSKIFYLFFTSNSAQS